MKNPQQLITFGIATLIAVNALATIIDPNDPDQVKYWERVEERIRQIRQKAVTDDEALKDLIRINYDPSVGSYSSGMLVADIRFRVENSTKEDEISFDREIKIMEIMVSEGLTVLEKGIMGEERAQAILDIDHCMLMLAAVPDFDIHPLLTRCFQNNNELFRYNILKSYVEAKNVMAIPFLLELIDEANLTEQSRLEIYRELERSIEMLKRQKKDDDVEKINSFLIEVRQTKSKPLGGTTQKDEMTKSSVDEIPPSSITIQKNSEPIVPIMINKTEQPHQKVPSTQNKKPSSNNTVVWFIVIFFLVIMGGVIIWIKRP